MQGAGEKRHKAKGESVEGQGCVCAISQFPAARWGHVTSCRQWNVGASKAQQFMVQPVETSPPSLPRPSEPMVCLLWPWW